MEKLLILSSDPVTIEAFSLVAAELSLLPMLKDSPLIFELVFSGQGTAGFIIDRNLFSNEALFWAELESLRLRYQESFIILVAENFTSNEEAKGYGFGADHCFTKPVDQIVLRERISSLLARFSVFRSARTSGEKVRRVAGLEIHLEGFRVRASGKNIPLTKAEFILLEILSRAPGKILSHEALGRALWGWDSDNYLSHIKCHISRLRSKLVKARSSADIVSVRGAGYALSPHVPEANSPQLEESLDSAPELGKVGNF